MTETEPNIRVKVRRTPGGRMIVLNDVAWVALRALIVDYLDDYGTHHEGAAPPDAFLALQRALEQEAGEA